MNDFTAQFLALANDRAAYVGNEPAQLIYDYIDWYADGNGLTTDEAIARLSTKHDSGESGQCGGVNVYRSECNSHYIAEYVTHDECTWMRLYDLVAQAISVYPNSIPDWFDSEWSQIDTKDRFAQYA
jgi:hypothetical protein